VSAREYPYAFDALGKQRALSGQSGVDEATLTRYLREIGRGKKAAGDLSREDAQALFAAMLAGRVADLQLGGILIALRVKGESLEELAGFAAACEASYVHLPPLAAVPVVIPSYNGARQLPNLVPLLALSLAKAGIPALVHGVTSDPGRVTTREVFEALGFAPAASPLDARDELAARRVSFLPIDALAPEIAGMLALRRKLGVRNSAHTLVKMLQPVAGPAVRLVSVTHPEYLVRMREFFTRHDTGALLLRGAEGEAVAHPRREPMMEWAHGGEVATWKEEAAAPPELPDRDAKATARWIESVLAGKTPLLASIQHQVDCCARAVTAIARSRQGRRGDPVAHDA
jgi:anthranilate phosphoribosyltransferase